MSELASDLLLATVATFAPLFTGLLAPRALRVSSDRFPLLVAGSSGIMFWFFLDVMNDGALLGVNQGFGGGAEHFLLALSFLVGILGLFGLERATRSSSSPTQAFSGELTLAVAYALALGLGFHALGEGIGIGGAAGSSGGILRAIGGAGPGVAYVLHKFLEGFVVGTVALPSRPSRGRLAIIGGIVGIPTLLGLILGSVVEVETTYFFALGGAGAVYAEFKLVPRFVRGGKEALLLIAALFGFYAMYLAGLFHG